MNTQITVKTDQPMKGNYRKTKRMKLLTTQEAADRLGVTSVRVRAMILAGRLPAEKFGHVHMIREEDLALVADRKPGRPPLTDEERAQRAAERGLPFEPPPPATRPKPKAATKKTATKKARKGSAK